MSDIVTITQVSRAIIVEEDNTTNIVTSLNPSVVVVEGSSPSITISGIGIQGPSGPPGTGGYSEAIAGTSISVYQVIVQGNDGKAYVADPTNISHVGKVLGVAIQSATNNNSLQYVSTGTINGGSWTPGTLYFVGVSGILSSSPIAVGARWSQFIGTGKSSTSFNVGLGIPVVVG